MGVVRNDGDTKERRDIADLLKSRNRRAFNYLYQTYAPALFGIITEATDNQRLAEKILQDCFVEIWSTISAFDPSKARLLTWLLAITLKQCRETLCQPVSRYVHLSRNH